MRSSRLAAVRQLPTGTVGLVAWGLFFPGALMAVAVAHGIFANDFHDGYWPAARALLEGHSPIGPTPTAALSTGQFVYPPIAALLLSPFGLLPRGVGDVVMTLITVLSVGGALHVLGVRDPRCYAVAMLWFPVFSGIQNANLSLPLVVGVALAWRYRQRALIVASCVALCVAVKLFLWPLLLWLAVTRWRTAALTVLIAAVLSLAGWAVVGFDQVPYFLHVLGADERFGAPLAYTSHALMLGLGVPSAASHLVAYALGACVLVAVAVVGRRTDGDRPAFILALAAALLLSPLVWLHYLTLLLVPLAITRPRLGLVWFLPLVTFGFSQPPGRPAVWEVAVVLVVLCATFAAALTDTRRVPRWLAFSRRRRAAYPRPASLAASVHSRTRRAAADSSSS